MLFFFKKKKIVVDCFTDRPYVMDYAKIDYANKFIPQWWKDLPATHLKRGDITEMPTMKTCAGFVELYKHGFIIPMWSDLAIEVAPTTEKEKKIRWHFSDQLTTGTVHSDYQRGSYLPTNEYEHFKIGSPWYLKCNRDVYFQFVQPTYNFDHPEVANILPGIVNYKYQHATAINMIFKKTDKFAKYMFNFGQPMVHIVPISEEHVELKHHLVSGEEMRNMFDRGESARLSFRNGYNLLRKLKIEKEKSKCPFHF